MADAIVVCPDGLLRRCLPRSPLILVLGLASVIGTARHAGAQSTRTATSRALPRFTSRSLSSQRPAEYELSPETPEQLRRMNLQLASTSGAGRRNALHLDLLAYGHTLVGRAEAGRTPSQHAVDLYSTIVVDGQPQRAGTITRLGEQLTTDGFDFLDATHNGYEHLGIVHRRKVILVKSRQPQFSDYWILCDLVLGQGTHRAEQFLHLPAPPGTSASDVHVRRDSATVRTVRNAAPNVWLQSPPDPTLDVRLSAAGAGPAAAAAGDARSPSPVAVYTRDGALPLAFTTVVFPVPKGGKLHVDVTPLPVTANGAVLHATQAVCLRVDVALERSVRQRQRLRWRSPFQRSTTGRWVRPTRDGSSADTASTSTADAETRMVQEWTDVVFISHSGSHIREYGCFSTDGELALLREDNTGRYVRMVLKHGSVIHEQWDKVLESDNSMPYVDACWRGAAVYADCVASQGLQFWAQSATRMLRGSQYIRSYPRSGYLYTLSAWREPLPVITGLRVSPQQAPDAEPQARISWRTDLPATTQVEFSAADGLWRRTTLAPQFVTEHSVVAEGLQAGGSYTFRAVSCTAAGRQQTRTTYVRIP